MVKKIHILMLIFAALGSSCFRSQPELIDGTLDLQLRVVFQDLVYDKINYLSSFPVNLISLEYTLEPYIGITDTAGCVTFKYLIWTPYKTSGIQEVWIADYQDTLTLYLGESLTDIEEISQSDTAVWIYAQISTNPGIKINEIFYACFAGPIIYPFDQYVELVNSGSDTLYLDGMIICRVGPTMNIQAIFQFPGTPLTGCEHPVLPGQIVLVASDAYDHRQDNPNSIDLSHADWEFYNSNEYNGFDNPEVPNLVNLEVGAKPDFGVNLKADLVILADGSDVEYTDGIELNTIVDGVEYTDNLTLIKRCDPRIDKGRAGVGITPYSGQSIERVRPGFDTDNSSVDFIILSRPTPGCQHGDQVQLATK
jgi:hypothetical protein